MRRLILAPLLWLAIAQAPLSAEPAPAVPVATAAAGGAAPVAAEAENPADAKPAQAPVSAPEATPAEPAKAAEPVEPPKPTLAVNINLTTQRMVVTENGKPKHTWAVSSGAWGYPTPTGTFNPTWMAKMWYSKQYDNAPMPHAIFFKNGAAIHATSSIHLLGTPASHGCVRLAPSNAAKLYALVSRHGKARTEITVHGRPKYKAPKIAKPRLANPPARYAYNPNNFGYQPYTAPRYVYPGDAPPAYYYRTSKQRAAALKKRRARQYYSAY